MRLLIATLVLSLGLTFGLSAQTQDKPADTKAKTEVTKTTKAAKKVKKAQKAKCAKSCEGKTCSDSEKGACCDKK